MNSDQNSEQKDADDALDARLRERLLLLRAAPDDRLMLADATMLAALDGSRVLTPNERTALQQSPLTLRRFRQLSLQRRAATAAAAPSADTTTATSGAAGTPAFAGAATTAALSVAETSDAARPAANDAYWSGSTGLLRAASSAAALERIATDDNCWTLHFLPQGEGWQVILTLSADAPYAARLLREQPMLRVVDGGGAIVLQGRLDADGECEHAWPFDSAPAQHFQLYGASFAVEPVTP